MLSREGSLGCRAVGLGVHVTLGCLLEVTSTKRPSTSPPVGRGFWNLILLHSLPWVQHSVAFSLQTQS